MAVTLDMIVNKVFKVVKNGYDNNEVESFLDEILEEMETREAQTNQLKEQVASLTRELDQAHAALAAAKNTVPVASAPAAKPQPVQNDHLATESFELVLAKAKGAYEEIVAAADTRAEEIIAQANTEAGNIRSNAETQIADLSNKLLGLRRQTSDYYASLKKIVDEQSASMDELKKLL